MLDDIFVPAGARRRLWMCGTSRRWRRGHPLGYVVVITTIYLTTRFGMAETVHPETAVLLDRPPLTMQQFISHYATVWQKTPRPQDKQTILTGG